MLVGESTVQPQDASYSIVQRMFDRVVHVVRLP